MTSGSRLSERLRQLHPVYFSLVMATGVIGLIAHSLKISWLAQGLFYLNNLQFGLLLTGYFLRLFLFGPAFQQDMQSSRTGAGFLTMVAGANMLGVQYALGHQAFFPATLLWFLALVVWLNLMFWYSRPTYSNAQPIPLSQRIHPSWLLFVVSVQSLVILGVYLLPFLKFPPATFYLILLGAFGAGVFIYLVLAVVVLRRLPQQLSQVTGFEPSYWVLMGGLSISTLAGAALLATNFGSGLESLTPYLSSVSFFCWLLATGWLPVLFLLELRKQLNPRTRLRYEPTNWTMAFSLGMYALATLRLQEVLPLGILEGFPLPIFVLAAFVWALNFGALLKNLLLSKEEN